MKVGTDGVLLGAWAHIDCIEEGRELNILDIGTGTGLIALMLAQRYTSSHVTAIEIDEEASTQAHENVTNSPFADRVEVINVPLQEFSTHKRFDLVVSNPPYFMDSLKAPDVRRSIARHTDTLTYEVLFSCAYNILSENGIISVVLPAESLSKAEECAAISGLFMCERIGIRTTPVKSIKRYLLSFCKKPCKYTIAEHTLQDDWYRVLTQDFYKMLN